MIEVQTAKPARKERDNSEFDLFDILIVLAKRKRLLFGFPLAVAIVAAGISLMFTNTYLGATRLLPPQQSQSTAGALLSQLAGLGPGSVGGGLKSPNELYVGMLKSRTVADGLIAEFDLKKKYATDSQEKARKVLEQNTSITSGKDGLIAIEVEDEDQDFVANLANGYVGQLIKLTKTLAVTEAAQRRLFFERQLELAKDNLAKAEVKLKGALDSKGVISVDANSQAIVETVSRLRARISAKEIELGAMRAFVTSQNPDFKRAQEELTSLRTELSRLENGRPGSSSQFDDSSAKPDGLDNIKVLRDLKYNQMLYELLAKQYEVARLDEAKDSSIIQVLDPAVRPERKYKPKRSLIVILAGLAGAVMAVVFVLVSEARQRMIRSPEGAAQWAELKSYLRVQKKEV